MNGKIGGYSDEWVRAKFKQHRLASEFSRLRCDTDVDLGMHSTEIDTEEGRYTVDLEDHWSEFVRDELRVLGSSSLAEANMPEPSKGIFYISPDHDVFITDYDCGMHFCVDSASNILGADFPSFRGTACNHISEKLPADVCQRVSTVALVRTTPSGDKTKHCAFAKDRIIRFDQGLHQLWKSSLPYATVWHKDIFPSVHTHFVLR